MGRTSEGIEYHTLKQMREYFVEVGKHPHPVSEETLERGLPAIEVDPMLDETPSHEELLFNINTMADSAGGENEFCSIMAKLGGPEGKDELIWLAMQLVKDFWAFLCSRLSVSGSDFNFNWYLFLACTAEMLLVSKVSCQCEAESE